MDHRVATIRRWLILIALAALCLYCEPGLWFCLFAAPIIWTRTSGGTTGILIHPDGSGGWKVAVGDSGDATCACCGAPPCNGCNPPFNGNYQVVIAGVANGTFCTGCTGYNGTWEVERSLTQSCNLTYTIGGVLGGGSCLIDGQMRVLVIDAVAGAAGSEVRADDTAAATACNWQKSSFSAGLEPDCSAYSSESYPTTSDTLLCNNVSGTALVTAL